MSKPDQVVSISNVVSPLETTENIDLENKSTLDPVIIELCSEESQNADDGGPKIAEEVLPKTPKKRRPGKAEGSVLSDRSHSESENLTTPTKRKVHKKKLPDTASEAADSSKWDKSEKPKVIRKSLDSHGDQMITEDEPKPRIVITLRSEKPGRRSSNMKVVSTEEMPTRRSPRCTSNTEFSTLEELQDIPDSLHDCESDEDMQVTPVKRSTRRRSKEFSDNILANAIARKEKYNETTPAPGQRLSRRIKPTAKVLANKELRLGLETQNNARLGLSSSSEKSPEEGVQPRRSSRRRTLYIDPLNVETNSFIIDDSLKSRSRKRTRTLLKQPRVNSANKSVKEDTMSNAIDVEEQTIVIHKPKVKRVSVSDKSDDENETKQERETRRLNKLKKKHLSKLGLKAVIPEAKDGLEGVCQQPEDDSTMDSTNTEAIMEHLTAPKQQAETKSGLTTETAVTIYDLDPELEDVLGPIRSPEGIEFENSDEDFEYKGRVAVAGNNKRVTRKLTRLASGPTRRSAKVSDHSESDEQAAERESPAGGDAGSEATDPGESARSTTACLCTASSNVYISPSALTEPVFCRAVECVDGMRVGCSHTVARAADGGYAPLRRAGVRAPFFLACPLHLAQLSRHMCCPACGLFCSQGTFYQCSEGHIFHLECGLPYGTSPDEGVEPGCPHCGLVAEDAEPLNRKCCKVKVEMKCSNRRIFLPTQRVQCTPAYLTFSKMSSESPALGPVVPEELLPVPPINLQRLRERGETNADYEELLASSPTDRLYRAIVDRDNADDIITKLSSGVDLNQSLDDVEGGTFLHLAAKRGNLTAAYLLHYAGCSIDFTDSLLRTPLMVAILALRDPDAKDDSDDLENKEEVVPKKELTSPEGDRKRVDVDTEGLLKVVRYLIAAGCDVNLQGVEGVTALHLAARHGLLEACERVLAAHQVTVDARDHGGWTPLVWAAENNHPAVVRMLLARGADASACDSEGNAAVHWCALAGDATCLQLLLDAAPRARDHLNAHGDTPLHVAARQSHYASVVVLLARGARTDVENSEGELAVEVCTGQCQSAISLNMQMALAIRDHSTSYKLLTSDISNGREMFPIPCVNDVDDAPLPSDFTYVTQHVTPHNLELDTRINTLQGCKCAGSECGESSCACCVLGVRSWYSHGRLVPRFPHHDPPMIFECNQTCKCNMKLCPNAVVTRASAQGATLARAQVFRAGGALGWGLRALAPVLRGAPVALYCGELLRAGDAETHACDHYMFALDLKPDLLDQCQDKTQLCVDAASYGSAARFINHSCRPNLAPVRVFTHTRDLRLPAVTLFATRDIRAFEEFTFDYGDKFWSVKSKTMHCCCGASDCRYPPNALLDAT